MESQDPRSRSGLAPTTYSRLHLDVPHSLPASLTRALEFHRAGQLAAAATLYREILQADPHQANALNLLGLITRDEGNPAGALELFSRAIAADPATASFRLNRGLNLRFLGRLEEALEDFRQARQLDPTLVEAHHQEGNTLKQLGRFPEAIAALRQTVHLAPTLAPAWLNLGVAYLENHDRTEAIRAFQQAITLEPTRPEAHNILGVALLASGQLSSARAAFAEALRLNPVFAPAHDNLGRLCKSEGLLADAILHFRAALAVKPDPGAHSNLLLALNYLPSLSSTEIFAEHRRWNQRYAAPVEIIGGPASPRAANGPDTSAAPAARRLRIGYVSPDFCHHAVSYFIAPVLAAHDRARVEIFCYSNVPTPDRVTERLRGLAEHWSDIARMTDDAAAARIRADKIDLLIDLAGHTAGHSLLLFARRPAPVQATWIGYPNTTGLDAIDCRITDAICDPPGEADSCHSEKLVRLPANFSCYESDPNAPDVNSLPAQESGVVTFGCFNNFAKVTPEVVALWARLLTELPKARLLLKSRGLGDPAVAARLRTTFANAGVGADRVVLNGEELSVAKHLSLYHGVDIGLDPFPYNGTTTTCEALWMGVPVLTLAGRSHAARVGASLLTHVGLGNWIAQSPDAYVALAVAAARDVESLARLRNELRERMRSSPLCDAPRFTRNFEAACFAMAARQA